VLTGTVPLELMKQVAGSPDAMQPVTQ